MKTIFRWLLVVLDAFIGVAEDKPSNCYMSISEAQEKYEAGLMSMRECNEIFERKEVI